jgi:hypothetical protein
MLNTHPRFDARLVKIQPVGDYTHAVVSCPRCRNNIGITAAMLAGVESIICKGRLGASACNGHYYWKGNQLEFVGTVP